MKSKIHLIYGIVIGILLCACFGFSTAEQKEFKEVHLVEYWATTEDKKYAEENGIFEDHPKEFLSLSGNKIRVSGFKKAHMYYDDPDAWLITGRTPNDLRKAGWTIIDMEFETTNKDKANFLIGK